MMTARQTTTFRVSRSPLPTFLNNRPQSVVNACLLSIEKAAGIELSSITEEDALNGFYKVTSKTNTYMVKIKEGTCSCPYFSQRQIPCKHIFSIFKNFQWTWEDLPHSLTESPLLILDNALLKRKDKLSDYPSGSGIEEDTEAPPNESDIEEDIETPPACSIPLHQTAGSRLFTLQKQIRDELAKCSTLAFMIDDTNALETIKQKIQDIHSHMMLVAGSDDQPDKLIPMRQLIKEEIMDFRKKSKFVVRANQITSKYKKLKRKKDEVCERPSKRARISQKGDPLSKATRRDIGRPKGKQSNGSDVTGQTQQALKHQYIVAFHHSNKVSLTLLCR